MKRKSSRTAIPIPSRLSSASLSASVLQVARGSEPEIGGSPRRSPPAESGFGFGALDESADDSDIGNGAAFMPEEMPFGVPMYTAEDFTLLQVLGRGGYGKARSLLLMAARLRHWQVLLAELKASGETFALKAMKKSEIYEVCAA